MTGTDWPSAPPARLTNPLPAVLSHQTCLNPRGSRRLGSNREGSNQRNLDPQNFSPLDVRGWKCQPRRKFYAVNKSTVQVLHLQPPRHRCHRASPCAALAVQQRRAQKQVSTPPRAKGEAGFVATHRNGARTLPGVCADAPMSPRGCSLEQQGGGEPPGCTGVQPMHGKPCFGYQLGSWYQVREHRS